MLWLLSLMFCLIDCRWGGTALHLAAIENQIETARLLLQRSVDVGAKEIQCVVSLACSGCGMMLCVCACMILSCLSRHHCTIYRSSAHARGAVSHSRHSDMTALDYALEKGHSEMAELLRNYKVRCKLAWLLSASTQSHVVVGMVTLGINAESCCC
jgi:hypothetical protein